MTVRVGNMTFSDWVSLPFRDKWTDTFIFRIDAQACIPPFEYAPLLRRIVARVRRKRSCASLWVKVDGPGDWFVIEVRKSLKGLKMPHAVTHAGRKVEYKNFSFPPTLLHSPLPHPPIVEEKLLSITEEELRCLQVLGRMKKGNEDEIASLAGLPNDATRNILTTLKQRNLVEYKSSPRIKRGKSKPTQLDLFSSWHTTSEGLSVALRSWGVPKGMQFTARLEKHLSQIGNGHRTRARIWSAWLKSAWPQVEIWANWSEVRLPEVLVIPDGLVWGRIDGYETLFWLEVGDGHKSREQIIRITQIRLNQGLRFCKRTGVRLVYTQLSTKWVHDSARWGLTNLSPEVAVVMGDQRKIRELPVLEWGKITAN
jgi:hypothetical protein